MTALALRTGFSFGATFYLATMLGCGPAPRVLAPGEPAAASSTPRFGAPFVSPLHTSDPRVGQILLGGKEIQRESEWLERAFAADVVYLGEKHDNADHHRLQAYVIEALVKRGARPSLVLEMVDEDEQAKLDALSTATDTAQIREGLAWSTRGWPAFELYEPIFRQALLHRLPIVAGNAPKATIKQIAFAGHDPHAAPLEPAQLARFGLDVPLPASAQASLDADLVEAHCGMLPASAVSPMALAQRARDFTLAKHARGGLRSGPGPRSVVIAGAGHARTDRGAPYHAHRADPSLRQLSVAFAEVSSKTDDAPAPYDMIWFTPVANEDDHCKDFGAPKQKPGGA